MSPLGAAYLAVFTVGGAVGALGGTTWIRSDTAAFPGTLLFGAVLMAAVLVASPPPRMGLLLVAWVLSPLLMAVAAWGLWSAVLTDRGQRVEATVISLRDAKGSSRHLYYTLADPSGRPIPGELGRWPGSSIGASGNPEGTVGQRVTVVRDPEGLVDPRLPEELTDAAGLWIIGPGVASVIAVLCVLAGRPVTDDRTKRSRRRPAKRSAAKSGTRPRRKGKNGRRSSGTPQAGPSPHHDGSTKSAGAEVSAASPGGGVAGA
ncbi:hypothetical protein [Catellatospora sichuanensis]|uniref:hypothetical protein n=1 Tax=Catellatospora sichuanensis TaxID=1969805 RepID=UPI001642A5DF|nr:hypothetical protein [Catellatospora sichuanensis]